MTKLTLYRIVEIVNGKHRITETTDVDDYDIIGFHHNERSRPELLGQPKLSGFLGPMSVSYTHLTLPTIYSV